MRILGYRVTKDYETPKALRRLYLEDILEHSSYRESFVEQGLTKSMNLEYWWEISGPGISYPKQKATLRLALKEVLAGFWRFLRDPKAKGGNG